MAIFLSRIKGPKAPAGQLWALLVAISLALILTVGSPGGWGLKGKTRWDWLQLAGVPVALAGLGIWFQHQQRKRDEEERKETRKRDEAERNEARRRDTEEAKEEVMQRYFDRVSSLLIDKRLIETAEGSARIRANYKDPLIESAKDVIRARTLQIVRRLGGDPKRQSVIFQFLHETGINSKLCLDLGADLSGDDFSDVKFFEANLSYAELSGAKLIRANLSFADLKGANLFDADLSEAVLIRSILIGAFLYNAILNEADLRGAFLNDARLIGAKLMGASLMGAELDGALLHDADLRDADLREACLYHVKWNENTVWPNKEFVEGVKNIPPALARELGLPQPPLDYEF